MFVFCVFACFLPIGICYELIVGCCCLFVVYVFLVCCVLCVFCVRRLGFDDWLDVASSMLCVACSLLLVACCFVGVVGCLLFVL